MSRYANRAIGLVGGLAIVGLLVSADLRGRLGLPPEPSTPAQVADGAGAGLGLDDGADGARAANERATAGAAPLELDALSETFRNTSLLMAIRAAGFVCDEVVAAYSSGARVWTASCRDLSGYKITADASEELQVEPIARYFDPPRGPPPEQRAPRP
jgi:hypothetical protein